MARITFSDPDIGEVDLDQLECYENIVRSAPYGVFGGESDRIPDQEDEIRLRFKDGTTNVVKDLSAIIKLEGLQIPKCRGE